MYVVAFAKGANFGCHSFLLLQEHAPGLQIADPGDHGTLHDGAAFIIFDVAHPAWFLQCNLFCEALLFEIANGVVVGIGQEMFDGRRGFDVIFQVRHQMSAVAFHLLIRGDGAKDDLSKFTAVKWAVSDSPSDLLASGRA